MSERSLISFVLFRMQFEKPGDLHDQFSRGLTRFLDLEEFSTDQMDRIFPSDRVFALAPTANRKALEKLNDLSGYYEHAVLNEGGLDRCNLWEIIRKPNRTPQRSLGWSFPIEVAKELARANAT
jgi:hypothetical protein